MTNFKKVVRLGRQPGTGFTFCKITFTDGRLSITGVEGPTKDGNARGSCGQIDMHEWTFDQYAPGWDAEKVARFLAVWSEWHLNDMKAGSPAQEAFLKANPITDRLNHYTKACAALTAAGINPGPGHIGKDGKPYRYGSAWLRCEVPEDVIAFLRNLPDTDITPAWV